MSTSIRVFVSAHDRRLSRLLSLVVVVVVVVVAAATTPWGNVRAPCVKDVAASRRDACVIVSRQIKIRLFLVCHVCWDDLDVS